MAGPDQEQIPEKGKQICVKNEIFERFFGGIIINLFTMSTPAGSFGQKSSAPRDEQNVLQASQVPGPAYKMPPSTLLKTDSDKKTKTDVRFICRLKDNPFPIG